MILIHKPAEVVGPQGESLDRYRSAAGRADPDDALWIDLIEPTREEDRLVESHLNIEIPTREEMADIEPSEILYHENNARYMTARVLCSSDTDTPEAHRRVLHPDREGARDRALRRAALLQHVHGPRREARRLPAPAGGRARRIDRDHHRPRRRNPRHGRNAHRPPVAGDLRERAAGHAPRRLLSGGPELHRPQGRHHLQRAREHGVGGAHAAVPLGQHAAAAEDGAATRRNGARRFATCSPSRSTRPSCPTRSSSCSMRRSASSPSSRTTSSRSSRSCR